MVKSFTTPIERLEHWISAIDRLTVRRSRRITLRFVIGILPAMIGSLLSPGMTAVLTLFTLIFFYAAVRSIQQDFLIINKADIFWHIITPLHIIIPMWAMGLTAAGKILYVSRVVGPVALMAMSMLWPAYKPNPTHSDMLFDVRYGIAALLVVMQQLIFLISG